MDRTSWSDYLKFAVPGHVLLHTAGRRLTVPERVSNALA
jgi:hypothetical protein